MAINVLYEDNHLLVVNKPSELPTMGATPGMPSLHALACDYVRVRYAKPGKVYLGVVMRLDAGTSGVVVFARTSKAAARVSQALREHRCDKWYWAVLERRPAESQAVLEDWLVKDEEAQRMRVVAPRTSGAKQARLQYRVVRELRRGFLIAVALETGRKHQIRAQFSYRGWPLLGDRKYGARHDFSSTGFALHAAMLGLQHPVKQEPMRFRAPLPSNWIARGVGPDEWPEFPLK